MRKIVIAAAMFITFIIYAVPADCSSLYGSSNLWPNNPPTPPVMYGNDATYNKFLQDQYNRDVQRYLEEEQRRRQEFEEDMRELQRQRELDDFMNRMRGE